MSFVFLKPLFLLRRKSSTLSKVYRGGSNRTENYIFFYEKRVFNFLGKSVEINFPNIFRIKQF